MYDHTKSDVTTSTASLANAASAGIAAEESNEQVCLAEDCSLRVLDVRCMGLAGRVRVHACVCVRLHVCE